jgi:hypothetical protein
MILIYDLYTFTTYSWHMVDALHYGIWYCVDVHGWYMVWHKMYMDDGLLLTYLFLHDC